MTVTAPARAAELFRVLSDPTRLEILSRLGSEERCVCELMGVLGAAQSRLSFHLRVLKDAGLVTDRRDGRWVYYTVVPAVLDTMRDVLDDLTPTCRPLPLMTDGGCCD